MLWSGDYLSDANADNETEQWIPGCLLIGSDAGDLVYGIDMRAEARTGRYIESEDSALSWDYILWQGRSLEDLLAHADRRAAAPAPGSRPFLSRLRRRRP